MFLNAVLVRFYKSFNYDYLRMSQKDVADQPLWTLHGDLWYPHVRVPINREITAVVGENESGKSCLLDAIASGVSGEGIERRDFCRHSELFTVTEEHDNFPEFGCHWTKVSDEERQALRAAPIRLPEEDELSELYTFRKAPDKIDLFWSNTDGPQRLALEGADSLEAMSEVLPSVFRLDSDIGLPTSVPITYLAGDKGQTDEFRPWTAAIDASNSRWFESEDSIRQHAANIRRLIARLDPGKHRHKALELAHDLVRKIAGVGGAMLGELQAALDERNEGFAEAIIERINQRLEATLNLSAAWAQDQEFKLEVSARSKELVFSVRDRTNAKYAFGERSDGLRYFLSYYVQYLAYEPPSEGKHQVLLMDEPDTYLSSRGQQDLLRIFQKLARPEPTEPPRVQVVYVTHSPFLLDKNHAERIRVLQKGSIDEGTRVVRDVGRNHYEPLRSAFGTFVAETSFIGNCNIMVEGQSDQILLAGATRYLRSLEDVPKNETLNLNEVTLVMSGGAANVPYLAFLARGRDVDKPAVVVLLDSDKEGSEAKKVLLKGVGINRKRKKLLKQDYVIQIGEVVPKHRHVEDFIPLELAVEATNRYLQEYCASEPADAPSISLEDIKEKTGPSPFDAIRQHLESLKPVVHMEKVGFALKVVEVIQEADGSLVESVQEFAKKMRTLLSRLNETQRKAVRDEGHSRDNRRFNRAKDRFLRDHPGSAKKYEASQFIRDVEDLLDNSIASDTVSLSFAQLAKDFDLGNEPTAGIEDYTDFVRRLKDIPYEPIRWSQEKNGDEED